MNIRCYIVDREGHGAADMQRYVITTPGLELAGVELNSLQALNKITGQQIVADITFMDIDMQELSGLELAGLIASRTKIIFTTALSEYAAKAFEMDAVDYLLKPVSYERFLKSINKAKARLQTDEKGRKNAVTDHFYIQSEVKGKLVRINYDDVVYVESAQNYVRIHLENTSYLTYLTMKEIQEALPSGQFRRVHKSFIVNLEKAVSLENTAINLSNGAAVTLGQSYRKALLDLINPLLVKSKRL